MIFIEIDEMFYKHLKNDQFLLCYSFTAHSREQAVVALSNPLIQPH